MLWSFFLVYWRLGGGLCAFSFELFDYGDGARGMAQLEAVGRHGCIREMCREEEVAGRGGV